MTVNQMRYFVALCKFKSFSKAAESLFVTQPAISRQIAAMEEELGIQLINHNRAKSIDVTPAGKKYAELLERFLDEKDNLEYLLKKFEIKNNDTFRIGLPNYWFLPGFVASCNMEVQEKLSGIDLSIEFLSPELIKKEINERNLDAAILAESMYESNNSYIRRYIRDICSVIFVSAESTAMNNGKIDIRQLKGPFVSLECMVEGNAAQYLLNEVIKDHKISIRKVNTLEDIKQNVLALDGISYCDEWSEPVAIDLFATETIYDFRYPVILVYKNTEDPVFLQVVQILEEQLHRIRTE